MQKSKIALICELYDNGAIRFGSFKTVAKVYTPIFIDLRVLVSYPKLLHTVASIYVTFVKKLSYDLLVSIPLGSLPIGTIVSQIVQKPMAYVRMERKKYGTKKTIEGCFTKGDRVILIDDVIEKGIVKKQVIRNVQREGLVVTDVVVLVNHPRGGKNDVQKMGIHVHNWTDIQEITEILWGENRVTEMQYREVMLYVEKLSDSISIT